MPDKDRSADAPAWRRPLWKLPMWAWAAVAVILVGVALAPRPDENSGDAAAPKSVDTSVVTSSAGETGRAASTLEPAVEASAEPPSVVGQRLDEARRTLLDLGFRVEHYDVVRNRGIWNESNWEVLVQDRDGELIRLGVSRPHERADPSVDRAGVSDGPAVWNDVTDGVWDHGDYGLGEPVRGNQRATGNLSSDYEITIPEPPVLTLDGRVTMTSRVLVTRVQDLGFGENVTRSQRIWFQPGNFGYPRHDEAYGLHTRFTCEREQLEIGESTECTVSFSAPVDEIQDSYWIVNGRRVAAWPSQVP